MNQVYDEEIGILLEKACARSLEAEIYLAQSRSTKIRVQDGSVESFTVSESRGVGLRVVAGKRVGYAYTESFDPEDLEEVVCAAAQNAALLPADEAAGLADFRDPPPELALYNPSLDAVTMPRKIAMALDIDRLARAADPRIKTVTGVGYADGADFVRIANTLGVDRQYRESAVRASCAPLLSQDGQLKTYYMSRIARDFGELDPEAIAQEAVLVAASRLGAKEIPTGDYSVLFTPEAFADLLGAFCSVVSGKVAQEGKSLLAGREGDRVASSCLTLIDDPLCLAGFGARPFDDEGCPSKTLSIIDRGVFLGFLHNVQSARRAGKTSTGHASRGGYGGVLQVWPTNLVVRAGASAVSDLRSAEAVVLEVSELMGLHSGANPVSGDFSLQAQGTLYDRGSSHVAHRFTISGNFFGLLERIERLGTDSEWRPSGICSPSVLALGLQVAGS